MTTPEKASKPVPAPPTPVAPTIADVLAAVRLVDAHVVTFTASLAETSAKIDAMKFEAAQNVRTLTTIALAIQKAQAHP